MPKTYVGDDTMKCALLRIAKPVLSRRELAEVLRRAWYHVIEQSEHDSASRFRVDRHIELHQTKKKTFQPNFADAMQVEHYGCAQNTFALFLTRVCRVSEEAVAQMRCGVWRGTGASSRTLYTRTTQTDSHHSDIVPVTIEQDRQARQAVDSFGPCAAYLHVP